MNAKDLKFLELFEQFVKVDFLEERISVTRYMNQFMDLDYLLAVDIWDYIISTREAEFCLDERFCALVGFELFNQFYNRAATKCVKAISQTPTIRRAVYQYTAHAAEENALTILVDLVAGGKVDAAEEIFKCWLKNDKIHYGQACEALLKRVFIELLKKNPAKIEMNKKVYTLLLNYFKKIKTDERAMLEQRIKETQ